MSGTLLPDAAALAAGAPTAAALWRREIVATLRLALPLVFAQLGMIAINTTGILMMGWLGPQELAAGALRSEEHTSELQSLMRISYAVFCLKKKKKKTNK